MNKQQLQQEIEALQKQLEEKQKALSAMPEKWEPKGGDFWIDHELNIHYTLDSSQDNSKAAGAEYATHQQAEKAAKAMRAHNRLLAYVAEFAPDWDADLDENMQSKSAIAFNGERFECWDYSTAAPVGIVLMPKGVARELCRKLNTGEVEL